LPTAIMRPGSSHVGRAPNHQCDLSACDMSKNRLKNNKLRHVRESLLLSKSELARKAGISPLTIDRIERGYPCRVDTKRKIINALGIKISEKDKVFND